MIEVNIVLFKIELLLFFNESFNYFLVWVFLVNGEVFGLFKNYDEKFYVLVVI